MYFDDGRSMYMAPVYFIQVDTTVKVLESRFFTHGTSQRDLGALVTGYRGNLSAIHVF